MFFSNIKLSAKTLKTLGIVLSLLGVIFIIAAGHIGNLTIRIAMVVVVIFSLLNLKMTYHYSGKLKRITNILILIGSVAAFIFPQFVVFIIGIAMICFSAVTLFQIFEKKDYDDKVKLIASIVGIVFSIFCIFNSRATLEIVIRLIGAVFLALGCVCFYQYIAKSRQKENNNPEYKFEDSEKMASHSKIIDVEEITDIEEK